MRLEFSRQIFEQCSIWSFIKIRPVGYPVCISRNKAGASKLGSRRGLTEKFFDGRAVESLIVHTMIGTKIRQDMNFVRDCPVQLVLHVNQNCTDFLKKRLVVMYRLMHRAVENLLLSFGWTSDLWLINSYSLEQSPSWEANSSSASQEVPRNLWNPNVYFPHSRAPATCHNLSQINPVHASWGTILILFSHYAWVF